MSELANPNINAAGLTADIIMSIRRHARNNAKDSPLEGIDGLVIEFVVELSEALDILHGVPEHLQAGKYATIPEGVFDGKLSSDG